MLYKFELMVIWIRLKHPSCIPDYRNSIVWLPALIKIIIIICPLNRAKEWKRERTNNRHLFIKNRFMNLLHFNRIIFIIHGDFKNKELRVKVVNSYWFVISWKSMAVSKVLSNKKKYSNRIVVKSITKHTHWHACIIATFKRQKKTTKCHLTMHDLIIHRLEKCPFHYLNGN